jgi:hypothetical protein
MAISYSRQPNTRQLRGLLGIGLLLTLFGLGMGLVELGIWKIAFTRHGPAWVGTVAAPICLFAGVMLLVAFWVQRRAFARKFSIPMDTMANLALSDFDWDVNGYEPARAGKAIGAAIGSTFLTLFGVVITYLAFKEEDKRVTLGIVGAIVDLIALGAWGAFVLEALRAGKFGRSQIEFTRFPYSIKEGIQIRWRPPTGIAGFRSGQFTLRCVEEWDERSGKNTTNYQDELWSGTWKAEKPGDWVDGESIDFSFILNSEAKRTRLTSEDRRVFWVFEVQLDTPGPNFTQTYLVPIY